MYSLSNSRARILDENQEFCAKNSLYELAEAEDRYNF